MIKFDREEFKKAHPFVTESVKYIKRRKNELSALSRHLSRKRFQKNNEKINKGKIKVVFICQYIPAWSKNKRLYETLRADSRFEVVLLCIPNRVSANKLVNPEDMSNDAFEYFRGHGYAGAVNALIGKDKWFDLKRIHPDYVFYNRYDRPMPVCYTSTTVSNYSKVCLIVYGTALTEAAENMTDKSFMANTFCLFAESKSKKRIFKKWNIVLCKLDLSQAVLCGIAGIENAYKAKDDICPAWDFSKNDFRRIYAPRWTLDQYWGGSTFLKYKDSFINLADNNPDIDILVRPHPLMFNHFVEIGVMTEQEVEQYKNNCRSRNNIRVDNEKEYLGTFWNSSVLICDFSSMIIEYFITGKPIIYLTYDSNMDYTSQMKEVLSRCYIVNSENEMLQRISELKNGIDPLARKRLEICQKEFSDSINASENMKQVLLEGYTK